MIFAEQVIDALKRSHPDERDRVRHLLGIPPDSKTRWARLCRKVWEERLDELAMWNVIDPR